MPPSISSKKEIRLKVAPTLYSLLSQNASAFGVKPNDYIVYLIIDDIKENKVEKIPFLSSESEQMVKAAYEEITDLKKKGKLKGMTIAEIMQQIK